MRPDLLPLAALMLGATLMAAPAAAQEPGALPGSSIVPDGIRFLTPQPRGLRTATAVVNGELLAPVDVDRRAALMRASSRVPLSPDEVELVRERALRNLIDETLLIQAAAQQEIAVEPRETDAHYRLFARGRQRTPEAFSAYLSSIGGSELSLKRQIRSALAWHRLTRRGIETFAEGSAEAEAVARQLADSLGTPEYHVAEIFLSSTPANAARVRADAARLVRELRAGASFADHARRYSQATTAALGGELGWIRTAQLPDQLAAVVGELAIGAPSDPIPIPGGFSILTVRAARQGLAADARDAVLSLIRISLDTTARAPGRQARTRAAELGRAAAAMGGCGGAVETAQRIGAEILSDDQLRVHALPPRLRQVLLGLRVGQATPPFAWPGRLGILVLCGRDDAPGVGVGRRARRYLRDLRRDAVIRYR